MSFNKVLISNLLNFNFKINLNRGVIKSIKFNPYINNVVLTAGLDKRFKLYKIKS